MSKKLTLEEHLLKDNRTNLQTKIGRDTVTLSTYVQLRNGWVDKNGELHKLTPNGAAEKRLKYLKRRYYKS